MHLLRARRGVFVGKFWRRPRSPAQATLIGYAGWLCRGLVSATSYTLIGVANKLGTVLLAICFLDKHASARRAENRQKGRGISTRHPRRRRDPAHPNVVEMSTGTHLERRKKIYLPRRSRSGVAALVACICCSSMYSQSPLRADVAKANASPPPAAGEQA